LRAYPQVVRDAEGTFSCIKNRIANAHTVECPFIVDRTAWASAISVAPPMLDSPGSRERYDTVQEGSPSSFMNMRTDLPKPITKLVQEERFAGEF
jgi:hypothetical protein